MGFDGILMGFGMGLTRPGHDCYIANWKMAIEIVDLPIENGDFAKLCERLPEGTLW